jgi:DNA-binding NarL/FixJ family response regulator
MSLPAGVVLRPTVLVADDRPESVAQLVELLRPRFDVLATVPDGLALVSAATRFTPDVILTDIAMPGLDGIEAARRIRRDRPTARIVFVTVHAENALVNRCLGIGALGYVLKDAAGDDLVAAVEAALRGERYVSGDLHWRSGEP